ncbi:MAG: (Fe-S)-binding protein [Thermoplasmata archaeon]
MPIPIKETLGMLSDNLELRASVLPISRRRRSAWTRGLGIPHGGPTVLYTGQMYQIVPAINAMTARLARMEGSWMARYFGLARRLNRWVNLAGMMARGDPTEVREATRALQDIARLLQTAGVEFGSLGADDLYAGALAHDEGLDDVLVRHAERVYAGLRSRGVKEVITVDPHTTYMLRSIYPRIVRSYDLKVRTYLEVLVERSPRATADLDVDVTIHDSCLYARREGVAEQPRELLRRGGVRIHEAELSGRATQCCGGPIEMLFPARSNEIARQRIEQLAKCSSQVVTLCPLCLANLRRAAPKDLAVTDVSSYLARAYGSRSVAAGGARLPRPEPSPTVRTPAAAERVPGHPAGSARSAP